jgi:hypothetical protein
MSFSLACDGLPNCGDNQIPNPDEACFKVTFSTNCGVASILCGAGRRESNCVYGAPAPVPAPNYKPNKSF